MPHQSPLRVRILRPYPDTFIALIREMDMRLTAYGMRGDIRMAFADAVAQARSIGWLA